MQKVVAEWSTSRMEGTAFEGGVFPNSFQNSWNSGRRISEKQTKIEISIERPEE